LRADETTAALIWARLDFDRKDDPKGSATVAALWDLAEATGAVRDAFLAHLAHGSYQLETFISGPASIGRAFGLRPPATTVQRLLGPVLDAIRQTIDPDQLSALAQAVQTLAPRFAPDQAGPAIEISRTRLAAAEAPMVAQAFARALALTLPLDPAKPESYVAAIVELLKWPTTAQPDATDALLEVLRDRLSDGVPPYARPRGYRLPPPGKEAGLEATVAWVARTYPDIDLDSPPTYPASGSTGRAW
jgi:hypothetical protein